MRIAAQMRGGFYPAPEEAVAYAAAFLYPPESQTFSNEGLVAMAGEDANVEIALARSLVEHMDEGDVRRHWSRTLNTGAAKDHVPGPGNGQLLWPEPPVSLINDESICKQQQPSRTDTSNSHKRSARRSNRLPF
jgi:hypothetical protein